MLDCPGESLGQRKQEDRAEAERENARHQREGEGARPAPLRPEQFEEKVEAATRDAVEKRLRMSGRRDQEERKDCDRNGGSIRSRDQPPESQEKQRERRVLARRSIYSARNASVTESVLRNRANCWNALGLRGCRWRCVLCRMCRRGLRIR